MKLRTRFNLLFVVLIITFSSIALFTSFSLLKISRFTEIDKKVYQLYNLSLELKKNESDYFNWDLKNPDYFKTGKSENFNLFKKNSQVSDEICSQLVGTSFIKRNNFDDNIKGIKQLLFDYQNLLSIIEKNKSDLGFEEWGLIGQMNSSVSTVESEIEKQNNLKLNIQILTLREHEKDYLFRRNFKYKELFDRKLFSIFKEIKSKTSENSGYEQIYNSLKLYGINFNNLVEKDFYIGLSKDEGLMASLEKKGDNLNKAITSLSQSISKKTNQYIALTTIILLFFIIICTLVALLIGSLIIKRILKLMGGDPEEVAAITKNISKGDLRFHLEKSSEYHGVMKSVVTMTEKLKGIISGIYQNSNQIASASKQFSYTSHKISMGAISQSSFVEDISSRIGIIKIKTSSNSSTAIETNKIASITMDSMHKIKDQSDLSLQTSNEIAEKVHIIDEITFQTKLLALNAAVEAAHAGSFGNAFQVIAEEIKRLAEVSKGAAIEIKKLTEKNQTQSELVRNMVFEILIAIENTSELIKNIAQASQEQDNNINQISFSINHLHEVSQENAVASEEMAASTEELEKQVIALKEMVSYFKVGKDVENGKSYSLLTQGKEKTKKEKKKVISLFKKIRNGFPFFNQVG
jgi:methyl-accepting chemotaxis protein